MNKWISCLSLMLFAQSPLFADDAPPPAENGLWQMLITVGMFVFFFYFILFRPEQKRRQASEVQRSQLKKGDKVVAMGIVGVVARIQDTVVTLRMIDGTKIEVLKAAISDVIPPNDEDAKKAEKEDSTPSKKIESIDS